MNDQELIQYMANIILMTSADGKITEAEGTAVESILGEICGRNDHVDQALAKIKSGYQRQAPVGRYSDQVRNLEDMILVSLADRDLPASEKALIKDFAQELRLTQEQLNRLMKESQKRALQLNRKASCPRCGRETAAESRFCPHCGAALTRAGGA